MHIPDGLMHPLVAALGWVEFLIVLAVVLAITGKKIRDKNLPRVAILSAGIFVAQMVNFPIGGGTTGHLIGGALFAVLVGPALAILGMTVVILIQALMFGDGGITALGLNALNMAIIAPLTGWGVFNLIRPLTSRMQKTGEGVALASGAWASVFVAAAACAAELTVSYAVSSGEYGIAPTISIPSMLAYHAVIAAGEAAITVGIVAYVMNVSPEMIRGPEQAIVTRRGLARAFASANFRAAVAIIVVFALALPFYFLYASEGADGLEQTMADAGKGEEEPIVAAPFSYGQDYFGALFAGIIGFLIVALAASALLRALGTERT